MNKSEQISELAAALVRAHAEIGAVAKGAVNPFFKSKYATLEAVIDAVKAALLKQEIVTVQGVHPAANGVAIETMLLHKSGQWISSILELPASKEDAQGYGSAITYGKRYGLQAMCWLPSEDDDGNAATATAPVKGIHKGTEGARGRVSPERRKIVEETSTLIKDALKEDRDFDAYGYCESFADADEKVYLWSFFDSKERSRLTTQGNVAKGNTAKGQQAA